MGLCSCPGSVIISWLVVFGHFLDGSVVIFWVCGHFLGRGLWSCPGWVCGHLLSLWSFPGSWAVVISWVCGHLLGLWSSPESVVISYVVVCDHVLGGSVVIS